VLEALDAVNLMTVHASKGLEFPIVFIVNLAKGASGPPKPVRVIVYGDEEPSVSIGPFVSESDEADRDREKHETRRLLYVACTRARDRLYFSSVIKDGSLAPGRHSLAEVLPESLKALFGRAASAFPECETLAWTGASGRTFEWRICRPPTAEAPNVAPTTRSDAARSDLLAPVTGADARPMSITEWLVQQSSGAVSSSERASDVTVGRIVHRLFQYEALLSGRSSALDEAAVARALLNEDERSLLADERAIVAEALRAWRAIRMRADVSELLASGRRFHEVPFSFVDSSGSPTVFRGTIDCLIQREDGSVVVVEFKTGAARQIDREQLEIYVRAATAIFPDASVEGRLIYP
jgi:ATP-dependent helicase/nuclease subunit A